MTPKLILGTLVLLLLVILYLVFERRNRDNPLIRGDILYDDSGARLKMEKALYDPETGLAGKPDYLIRAGRQIIPVEVKSGVAADRPYPAHVTQLLAYCLLVEKTYQTPPDYGILKYRNKDFRISYTIEEKNELITAIRQIRAAKKAAAVHRSHAERARCKTCGYRTICDEKLSHS